MEDAARMRRKRSGDGDGGKVPGSWRKVLATLGVVACPRDPGCSGKMASYSS
jgi:hypothetical protein